MTKIFDGEGYEIPPAIYGPVTLEEIDQVLKEIRIWLKGAGDHLQRIVIHQKSFALGKI
jgi:hypothetical protein